MKSEKIYADFLSSKTDKLSEQQLLSLLLRYCEPSPRKQAQQLLTRYGNLANLLDAKTGHLSAYTDLKEDSLALLRLVTELRRCYLMIRTRTEKHLRDSDAIARYLLPLFSGENEEVVYLLSLDEERSVLGCTKIAQGTADSASISPRILVREALQCNAQAVVLAHNHPSGFFSPSRADIAISNQLQEILRPLGITLLDHIIFSNDSHLSMRSNHYCDQL